jgi:homopolymeric O-antigen transport system permease protein
MWAVAQPLARLVVLSLVFTKIVPLGIDNYPVFLFAGLIAWMWFSSGVIGVTTSPVDQSDLFFRPGVPRGAIPLVSALTSGLDYLAALPILLIFLVFTTGVPPTALFLPVVMLVQLLLIMALGFPLAVANVHFRDVRHFVEVGLLLGFYLTPVFYDQASVPEPYQTLLDLNPMTQIVGATRDVLVEGILPDLRGFSLLALGTVAFAYLGYRWYHAASRTFVDQL